MLACAFARHHIVLLPPVNVHQRHGLLEGIVGVGLSPACAEVHGEEKKEKYIHIYIYVYDRTYVHAWFNWLVWLCMHAWAYVCTCTYIYTHRSSSIYNMFYTQLHVILPISSSYDVYIFIHLCTCTYKCVRVYVYMSFVEWNYRIPRPGHTCHTYMRIQACLACAIFHNLHGYYTCTTHTLVVPQSKLV